LAAITEKETAMFPATITLTVATVAKVLNRVNQDSYGSEYQLNDTLDSWNLKFRHSTDPLDGDGVAMKRHNVFLEHVVYPTATTLMKKDTVTVTFRHDKYSAPLSVSDIAKAVNVWLGPATNLVDVTAGIN
jgi:hypothetical protein